MTAKKLDFSMDFYGSEDHIKVQIYENESGQKMAHFDSDVLSHLHVPVHLLSEIVDMMQQVLNAAADTLEVKPYVSQLRQEVRAAHFARMALLAHGRDDAQSTT